MRSLVLAGLLLAGCGGPSSTPDAGDAPTSVIGSWEITWECQSGCTQGAINPLAYDDRLVVAEEGTATYASTSCADCGAVHTMIENGSCLTVDAGDDFGVAREAYEACAENDELTADVTWSGFPGPEAPRTFRLRGLRPASP